MRKLNKKIKLVMGIDEPIKSSTIKFYNLYFTRLFIYLHEQFEKRGIDLDNTFIYFEENVQERDVLILRIHDEIFAISSKLSDSEKFNVSVKVETIDGDTINDIVTEITPTIAKFFYDNKKRQVDNNLKMRVMYVGDFKTKKLCIKPRENVKKLVLNRI